MQDNSAQGADFIRSWFPTITLSIEFKTRIPSSAEFSDRTVGLYSESRFLHDPHARHNARVEVWTAPSLHWSGDCRRRVERQTILHSCRGPDGILMVPMDLNLKEGTRDGTKL